MTQKQIEKILFTKLGKNSKIIKPLLGGMMNESYIVENEKKEKFVFYIPTKQSKNMVNRIIEKENAEIAFGKDITSENIYFDIETGIKINRYIDGKSLDKVKEWDMKKVAILLNKLHSSRLLSRENYLPFKRFENQYEKKMLEYENAPNEKYQKLRNYVFFNKAFLESQSYSLCHNDSQRSNIILSNDGRYYLIDFEFSSNNDPLYDVAAFGNNNVKEGRDLLDCYFSRKPTKDEIKRFYLWRIFISLQWRNVAIIKHYQNEDKIHHVDFLKISNKFLLSAEEAYESLIKELKL